MVWGCAERGSHRVPAIACWYYWMLTLHFVIRVGTKGLADLQPQLLATDLPWNSYIPTWRGHFHGGHTCSYSSPMDALGFIRR